MKITIKECCKLMNITESKFYCYVEKGIIPRHCDKIKGAHGDVHLWDDFEIIVSIPKLKNYKRGQSVTKAQKKYQDERVKRLSATDKYSPLFRQFLFDHCKIIRG